MCDLFNIAFAWALLHEIAHLKVEQENKTFNTGGNPHHQEEFFCDEFATNFLLGDIQAYSKTHAQDYDKVKDKRQAGILLGLFSLTVYSHAVYTNKKELSAKHADQNAWSENETHPAVQARIDNLINRIGVSRIDRETYRNLENEKGHSLLCIIGSGLTHEPEAPADPK